MDSLFRPLKKALVYVAFTVMVLFIIFAVNQTAELYALAKGVHPYLGYAALVLAGVAFALILIVPLFALFSLRSRPEMPGSVDTPEFDRYVLTLKSRLKTNPYLLGQSFVFDESREPKTEVMRALSLLDAEAAKLIKRGASSVFLTTAVSQNGALDSLFVISSLVRMIWDVAHIYNQRPSFREITYLYGNIFATVLMARSVEDLDLMDDQLEPVIASILGGSLGSLIPGTVYVTNLLINSITEGSVNALLSLRVGAMAKRYSGSLVEIDKKDLRRSASMEAIGLLGGIIRDNTTHVIHAFGNAAKGATRKIFRRRNDQDPQET